MDDSINVHLSVSAALSLDSGFGRVTPMLFVRCAGNKTSVFLNWDLFLGSGETKMTTRFDKQKAKTKSWYISNDGEAAFFKGNDITFIKEMMKHDKLLSKITPYGENPVMAEFTIRGLSEAIKPLRKACHW